VWVFNEPRTGEPVKRELFANSETVIGRDVSDHVTHGSHNTNDARVAVTY